MSATPVGTSSVGSGGDMVARMRAVIPGAWFPITATDTTVSATPVLDGLLAGLGCGWSYCYALAAFIGQQARIGTASGSFLDMICADYFGSSIKRKATELDDTFRSRILANLLLPRATRQAVIGILEFLFNCTPDVFEPFRAADTGGYGGVSAAGAGGGGGYGTSAVVLGSANMPFQFLITVASGCNRSRRESEATFIDAHGAMQVAPRRVVRPYYVDGVASGILTEARSFNLIKDSTGWTGLNPSALEATTRWAIDPDGVGALWAEHPVLQVTVYSGGAASGPRMTAMSAEGPVTASLWLLLPVDHRFQSLSLTAGSDSNFLDIKEVSVDLSITGRWQRVFINLNTSLGNTQKVFMQIIGVAEALMITPLLTQCWQIEPGSTASSYIPSDRQIGIREADDAIEAATASSASIDIQSFDEAIGRVIPVGSVAWTVVLT